MFDSFPFWLARRLSLNTPADHNGDALPRRRSPGVAIAVSGVAVAMVVMTLSVAVVSGFKQRIAEKVSGFNSQITVTADRADMLHNTGGVLMTVDADMLKAIRSALPAGAEITPDIALAGILKTPDDFEGIVMRGPGPGAPREFVEKSLIRGRMPRDERNVDNNEIVLSELTATRLQLDTGARLDAHFFNGGRLVSRRLTVTGIYDTGFGDYDRVYAFAPNSLATRLAGVRDEDDAGDGDGRMKAEAPLLCTTLDINGLHPDSIERVTQRVSTNLMLHSLSAPPSRPMPMVRVDNVFNSGAQYFSWLDLLDTNVVVILVLMALVSAFTLISSLFILILERVSMIGTLKSLGATNSTVRTTFVYLTLRLVLAGMVIGNILALAVILVQEHWHIFPLDPHAYYLDYVPMTLSVSAWLLLNIGTLLTAALTLVLPSHLIATLRPADTIHFD